MFASSHVMEAAASAESGESVNGLGVIGGAVVGFWVVGASVVGAVGAIVVGRESVGVGAMVGAMETLSTVSVRINS
jgi:hypothetical protein